MKVNRKLAEEIVEAVNKTTNDLDAIEATEEILDNQTKKEHEQNKVAEVAH